MVAMDTIKERVPSATGPDQARWLDRHLGLVVTVNIAYLSGKTIVVDVTKKDIIYKVKRRIQHEARIPADRQRLIYLEWELHNGRTE